MSETKAPAVAGPLEATVGPAAYMRSDGVLLPADFVDDQAKYNGMNISTLTPLYSMRVATKLRNEFEAQEKEWRFDVRARPIEWREALTTPRDRQWDETLYGFSIVFDPDEEGDYRYQASWGEGDAEHFSSLEQAQQWCQATIDNWAREIVVVTPNAELRGRPLADGPA